MRIVAYLIEYLGKFKFIFKTILDYESGDQMGSFDAKKTPSKISCLGTFKAPVWQNVSGAKMESKWRKINILKPNYVKGTVQRKLRWVISCPINRCIAVEFGCWYSFGNIKCSRPLNSMEPVSTG
jgi:hypothetical protein